MTTLTTYYGNHDMRNKEGNLGNYNSKKEGNLFTTHQNLNFNTTSSLLNPGVKWFFLGQKCGVTFIFGGKNEPRTGEKIKKNTVGNIPFLTVFERIVKRYRFLRRFSNENVRSWPDSAAKPVLDSEPFRAGSEHKR